MDVWGLAWVTIAAAAGLWLVVAAAIFAARARFLEELQFDGGLREPM